MRIKQIKEELHKISKWLGKEWIVAHKEEIEHRQELISKETIISQSLVKLMRLSDNIK